LHEPITSGRVAARDSRFPKEVANFFEAHLHSFQGNVCFVGDRTFERAALRENHPNLTACGVMDFDDLRPSPRTPLRGDEYRVATRCESLPPKRARRVLDELRTHDGTCTGRRLDSQLEPGDRVASVVDDRAGNFPR
jgi:hypothetical protein